MSSKTSTKTDRTPVHIRCDLHARAVKICQNNQWKIQGIGDAAFEAWLTANEIPTKKGKQ